MKEEVAQLAPRVREILTAPNTDLSTISAKRVRLQLMKEDPSLTDSWVKDNKPEIDKLIGGIFEEVSRNAAQAADGATANGKRKREDADGDPPIPSSSLPMQQQQQYHASPSPTKVHRSEDKDAKLARALDSQLNARQKLPRAAAPPAKKASHKKKKSQATLDDDDAVDGAAPKKGGAKGGFSKEYQLSQPLSLLVAHETLSRPQVVKKLWEHIKGNQLQNPLNKKEIMCDAPMRQVFGVEKIDMFAMNKVLGQHLYEIEP